MNLREPSIGGTATFGVGLAGASPNSLCVMAWGDYAPPGFAVPGTR